MRRSFDNIERNRKPLNATLGAGCYVGYATLSGVWYIRKAGKSIWYAYCTTDRSAGVGAFYADTMQEVSAKLRSN